MAAVIMAAHSPTQTPRAEAVGAAWSSVVLLSRHDRVPRYLGTRTYSVVAQVSMLCRLVEIVEISRSGKIIVASRPPEPQRVLGRTFEKSANIGGSAEVT